MSSQNRRYLTDADMARIAELWRSYRSLKLLQDNALPTDAKGAWIREAAQLHMDAIAKDLERLFEETIDPKASQMDGGR